MIASLNPSLGTAKAVEAIVESTSVTEEDRIAAREALTQIEQGLTVKVVFFDLGQTLVSNGHWIEGAQDAVSSLLERGVRLGIITNTGNHTRDQLVRLLPSDFPVHPHRNRQGPCHHICRECVPICRRFLLWPGSKGFPDNCHLHLYTAGIGVDPNDFDKNLIERLFGIDNLWMWGDDYPREFDRTCWS